VIAVKDSFYVVPVGVEDECGVVPGVIVGRSPGRPLSTPPASTAAAWNASTVSRSGAANAMCTEPAAISCSMIQKSPRSSIAKPGPCELSTTLTPKGWRPLVERATPCDVAYWQLHMIKQARWPTRHGSSIPLGEGFALMRQRAGMKLEQVGP
jgi:hypothetical protein